ncbi:MAG: flagellar biosynthesis anti-sigma factor FlgM [Desulfosporosinus sp.]|nr:flagellar biosynthesis anti-sigma factor FlgM [Desulfosporosinus sp.]
MKIDGSPSPIGSVKATNRTNQVDKKKSASAVDQVAVSGNAQVYQALLQKVKELPAVREDKVQTLSAQIASGEFQVDGQKVAEKLFSPET